MVVGTEATEPGRRGARLLVADNDPFFQQLLRDVLEAEGYSVRVARDGLEAIDLLHAEPPDAVILDLIMPKIDGARLCWYLKEDPELARLPVIIVSAIVAEAQPRGLPLPADAIVAKGPARELAANVTAAVRQVLTRPRPPTPGAVFGLDRVHPREVVQELLALKRHHEALLDALGEAVLEADADGRVVYANALAIRLLGQPERVLLGRKLAEAFGPEPAPRLRESVSRLRTAGGPRLLGVDFACGAALLEGTLARLPDGAAPVGVSCIIRDVTPLRRAKRELESTFAAIGDAILLVDPERRVLRANPAAAHLASRNGRAVVGEQCCRLFCGAPDPPEDVCPVRETLRTGEAASRERTDPLTGRAVRCWAYPIRDSRGAVEAVVECQRDVTEERRVQAHLARTDKLASLGRLVAGIAHEILNPLSVVVARLDLLLREEPPAALCRPLTVALEHARRVGAITEGLLRFAREAPLRTGPLDLHAALEQALTLIAPELRLASIAIIQELRPDLPPVEGDGRLLAQVFLNLLANARDAIEGPGAITVRTRAAGPWIRVEISDTGSGIPAAQLGKIFDPFFTTKAEGRGSGLGLSVALGIVEAHGGRLYVESQAGRGSTFTVELPAGKAA
jgi:PAS domain S-box-containing protein